MLKKLSLKNMSKDLVMTSFWAMLGRSLGLLVPFFIAAFFGSDLQTDAFFLVFGIVLLLQMVLLNVFETAVVPYLHEEFSKNTPINQFLGGIFSRISMVLVGVGIVLVLIMKPFLGLISQFDDETAHLAYVLFLEMLPAVLFIAWTGICNGALNASKKFKPAAISPAIRSIVVIASLYALSGSLGVHSIAIGYTVGEFIRFLVSFLLLKKHLGGMKWHLSKNSVVEKFFKSALFQTGGFALFFLVPIVNQVMASWLGPGQLSYLTYAERLRNIPLLIFTTGLLPVVLSYWSSQQGGEQDQKKRWQTILSFFSIALVVSLLLAWLREPIVSLMLRGKFPSSQVVHVANIFGLFILSFPFDVLGFLFSRWLIVAGKDSRYLLFCALRAPLALGLNVLLMPAFEANGIALSFIIVNICYAALLLKSVMGMTNHAK